MYGRRAHITAVVDAAGDFQYSKAVATSRMVGSPAIGEAEHLQTDFRFRSLRQADVVSTRAAKTLHTFATTVQGAKD